MPTHITLNEYPPSNNNIYDNDHTIEHDEITAKTYDEGHRLNHVSSASEFKSTHEL
jgi:hypothetical protein